MSEFPHPYCIMVSDGRTMRSIHPKALGARRALVEAVLVEMVLDKPEPAPAAAAAPLPNDPPVAVDTLTQSEIARGSGFTGDSCTTCGQFMMKRVGTCLTCSSCGSTTGCG